MRSISPVLLTLLAACGSRPGGAPDVNTDPSQAWPSVPALDRAIVDRMDQDKIAGLSACIGKAGAVVWCGGYGEANPDTNLPALPTTPFMLASASKAVAAVAIMQVIEDGRFDVDTPVNDVLSFDVVHPDDSGTAITVAHLMTHTSGIADNWDVLEEHYVDGDSTEVLGTFLEGYLSADGAEYDAGANFGSDGVGGALDYSNIGAALAAYLVEPATGTPFDDWCDAHIFAPLGMNAGWHLADFDSDEVASPTLVQGDSFETIPHYGFPDYPDGQLRADAVSMATFVTAVAEGGTFDGVQILERASVDQMVAVQVPEIDPDQGLIWYRWTVGGETVIGHNGEEEGVSTELLYRPGDGVVAVVLMNTEGRAGTLEAVELALLEAAADL